MKLNIPQAQFLSLPKKYKTFVAGYGSGKTVTGCVGLCVHSLENPKIPVGYFGPTYPTIRDVFYPTIEEVAYEFGLTSKVRTGDREVDLYMGSIFYNTIKCRSMDNPGSIVGFKIGHAHIDELDVLKIEKAEEAHRKILARLRHSRAKNSIDITTTPEGFRYTHKLFVEQLADKPKLVDNYGLIQASTRQNRKNLPEGYIESLYDLYPEELIDAYIDGQFVNLTTGTVYRQFNRKTCNTTRTIKPKQSLYIGMDFNVQHMSAKVYIRDKDVWYMVDEIDDVYDTPDMIRIIKDRFAVHSITVYPDASGKSRKSVDASKSDISLLESSGFRVLYKSTNPAVKDRIMSVNRAFEKGLLKINTKTCPRATGCFEKQVYNKNGEPEKDGGYDHSNDAAGYPIAYEMPIVRPYFNTSINFMR